LSTALFAVGLQIPPEQFIALVASEEIVTAACATVADNASGAAIKIRWSIELHSIFARLLDDIAPFLQFIC
jgi:hypothetical protein